MMTISLLVNISRYNYSSTAKISSNATTYFEAVEIGNAAIKTKNINP